MSEKEEMGSTSMLEGPNAAQIKEQIEAKKRELKVDATAKPVEPAPEPESSPESATSEPTPDQTSSNKSPEPAPESSAGAVPGPTGNDKPEWKKWIEKKGFKSTEDMVRSMRQLEGELTRTRQGTGAIAPQPPAMPEPPYQPRQPQYTPPAPNIDEMAKRYNMDPADLERVAPLAADIADFRARQMVTPLMSEITQLRRENARSAELQGLKEDLAFEDPRVQFEMHQILETNPSILQNEPAPWRFAFNEALRTIGRRILEGSIDPREQVTKVSGSSGLPTAPPRTAGTGGSGSATPSGIQPTARLSGDAFNRLPAAEQRKVLERMGLVNEAEA